MTKLFKRICAFCLSLALFLFCSWDVFASDVDTYVKQKEINHWVKSDKGWSYQKDDALLKDTSCWIDNDFDGAACLYYFDNKGLMLTNVEIDDKIIGAKGRVLDGSKYLTKKDPKTCGVRSNYIALYGATAYGLSSEKTENNFEKYTSADKTTVMYIKIRNRKIEEDNISELLASEYLSDAFSKDEKLRTDGLNLKEYSFEDYNGTLWNGIVGSDVEKNLDIAIFCFMNEDKAGTVVYRRTNGSDSSFFEPLDFKTLCYIEGDSEYAHP